MFQYGHGLCPQRKSRPGHIDARGGRLHCLTRTDWLSACRTGSFSLQAGIPSVMLFKKALHGWDLDYQVTWSPNCTSDEPSELKIPVYFLEASG